MIIFKAYRPPENQLWLLETCSPQLKKTTNETFPAIPISYPAFYADRLDVGTISESCDPSRTDVSFQRCQNNKLSGNIQVLGLLFLFT